MTTITIYNSATLVMLGYKRIENKMVVDYGANYSKWADM